LTPQRLQQITAALQPELVLLGLPKFRVAGASVRLEQTLQQLGMVDAFQPGAADLSGMDGTRNLFIGAVVHQAVGAVDEVATEAAAATAVLPATTGGDPQLREVIVDRPFIFLIRDSRTGTTLFMGCCVDPRA
jgi:serpin B